VCGSGVRDDAGCVMRTDLTGRRFGRLVVTGFAFTGSQRVSFWDCQCDCGEICVANGRSLKEGTKSSCKCLLREKAADTCRSRTVHGHTKTLNGKVLTTRTYNSWTSMKQRCCGSSGGRSKTDYVDRGIIVCDRWKCFENFLSDMGERPPGTSLDRIDNDGIYEPTNCRWATPSQQRSNRRPTRWHPGPKVVVDGVARTRREWAQVLGLCIVRVQQLTSPRKISSFADEVRRRLREAVA
jgi:hypothetical protein